MIIITLLNVCHSSQSQSILIKGQMSSWFLYAQNEKNTSQIGMRYIPASSISKPLNNSIILDAEISINTYFSSYDFEFDKDHADHNLKPYRLWLRLSSNQFEARIGLQKINFGSASLLRPLMWFDRIDPRDPLQLTNGVYGMMLRYYFLNNANIWFWGLLGNDTTKGWELVPTEKNTIEYGGRLQYPLGPGEIGMSYHSRLMHQEDSRLGPFSFPAKTIPEQRFAVDGKWDLTIGLWFETVITHHQVDPLPLNYKKMLTLGSDYTFGLGNGLHVLGEYFVFETSEKLFNTGEQIKFSALSARYPIGILDQITAIYYYDWKNKQHYRFLSLQRSYDNWSFHIISFWNPPKNLIFQNQVESNIFVGKGLEVMIVFNH